MSILTLLAALIGSNWSTSCVMTQADGLQGYTVDQASFTKSSTTDARDIAVTFTRTWFEDQNCTKEKNTSSKKGEVIIGGRLNQNTFEADWNIAGKIELGAISVSEDGKNLRMATTSFGNLRNTMLSLFSYTAK